MHTVGLCGMTTTPTPPESNESALDQLHRLLRRVTWSTRYLPVIDGFRFLAIASVVFFHMNDRVGQNIVGGEWLRKLFSFGNIGVQLFFMISGFVLALPFVRRYTQGGKPTLLKDYFLRRLIRIEPTYLINLLLLFFVFGMYAKCARIPAHFCGCGNDYSHLGWSMLYLHNIRYHNFSFINFVAWSLEIEIQFYILMPFLAWVFLRIPKAMLRRLVLVSVCIPFLVLQASQHQARFPHGLYLFDQIQYFLLGIVVADVFLNDWDQDAREGKTGSWFNDLIAILCWSGVPLVLAYSRYAARFAVPFLLFVAFLTSLRSVWVRRLFSNRWIAVFGGMCYTIYLYHPFLLSKVIPYFGGFAFKSYWMNLLLVMPVVFGSVLAISAVLFLLFEKPFMMLSWRRQRATDEPQGDAKA